MADKRENWAEGGRTDVWVPEEDPQIAVLRIAHDLSEWFERYPSTVPGPSYESLLEMFGYAYELSKDENREEGLGEEERSQVRKAIRMIWLCCNGADPVAAWMWLEMTPHIEKYDESGRWILENISPISFSDEISGGQFIFGLETTWERAEGWEKHVWILRKALASVLPSQSMSDIEIWDRDFNVWKEDVRAA